MGLFDRFFRTVRAQLNHWIGQVEDPEKVLEQAVLDMQEDLIALRQAVAQAIAAQKRTERQYQQSDSSAREWYRRAELAMSKGDENLARQALAKRKTYQRAALGLKEQLDKQSAQVEVLKQNLRKLEGKIYEAKVKKDMYVARARSARASEQLHELLDRNSSRNSNQAFERMEGRVLELEARAEAASQLESNTLEGQFAALEGGSVEDELAALKASLQTDRPRLPKEEKQNPGDRP